MRTIPDVPKVPAWPVIHVNRKYKIIPRMFCRHGKNTPLNVPSFCVSVESVTETGGGVGGQLRRLAKLGPARPAAPQMVLLDLANGGYVAHEGEVDESAMKRLVDEFVAGRLELTVAS